jgi:hypothetical protein
LKEKEEGRNSKFVYVEMVTDRVYLSN